MTMYSEDQYALRAFRNGASGYVTKGCGADELVRAVRKVQGGGRYVTPSLAEALAASLTGNPGAAPHEALSDRELQVLRMLASGKAVKEIGFDLGLNEKTVSTYRTRMLEKLGLRTTAEIIRYAIRAGLVE
jgi:DNA-binding NarL/FixJ family response regulator